MHHFDNYKQLYERPRLDKKIMNIMNAKNLLLLLSLYLIFNILKKLQNLLTLKEVVIFSTWMELYIATCFLHHKSSVSGCMKESGKK